MSPNKKVTKEIGIGEALSSWPAPAPEPPSPMYPTRLALTMARSTLTYILSTAKMFRFLLCSGSASEIRQAANRNICELSENSTGLSGFGGVVHRRGRLCKKLPPMPTSLVTFLFGDKKVTHAIYQKSPPFGGADFLIIGRSSWTRWWTSFRRGPEWQRQAFLPTCGCLLQGKASCARARCTRI